MAETRPTFFCNLMVIYSFAAHVRQNTTGGTQEISNSKARLSPQELAVLTCNPSELK